MTWQNQKDIDLILWILDGYANEFVTEDGLQSLVEVLRNNYYDTSQVYSTDEIDERFSALFDLVYPVGSIYMSVNTTSPATLFGGTWEQIEGRFLLASGDLIEESETIASFDVNDTGGEATHTLTTDEMPSHNHGATYTGDTTSTKNLAWYNPTGSAMRYTHNNVGGGQAHNNMPPYLVVNVWKRTA